MVAQMKHIRPKKNADHLQFEKQLSRRRFQGKCIGPKWKSRESFPTAGSHPSALTL